MKITLAEWAAKNYSQPPNHLLLSKWRRAGQIYPPPERVGHEWFVEPDAERIVGQPLPNIARKLRAA